ncbi:acylneuraminate cytidylyltransferase family protein [Fulvivirga ligni]|uniref:acylneuraminate cytidylyltransferase family protein n=1 Tax=Fulvivirga ligni TaxID=2904246 RepID=UPI001F2CF3E8|nr:acylneuraminate cytidylyltransferase family protein [Fulvivirga ligni]
MRPFAGFQSGILELKLRQLLKSSKIDEVLLSTNDMQALALANELDPNQEKIKTVKRPNELCLDTTSLTDLIKYVPTVVKHDVILWGHATTPLAGAKIYDQAVLKYVEALRNGFDSLISGCAFKNFLFDRDTNKLITEQQFGLKWPRTQDLPDLFEVNHVIFMAHRNIYLKQQDRVGGNPYFYEMDKLTSTDIDWEEDFKIAEALYERFGKL